MSVADAVSLRSACSRMQAGSVIVSKENRVVAVGYNGWPAGYGDYENCVQAGCQRAVSGPDEYKSYADCISIHSEANALLVCDRREREGGTIYVSGNCCWDCAKLIANSGLARVVMRVNRPMRYVEQVHDLLERCGIVVKLWEL